MIITGSYPNLRLRRSRKFSWSRRLVQDNDLSYNDFILPIFLTEGKAKKVPIVSMPNVFRYSIDKLKSVVDKALKLGIPMVALFPYTNPRKRDEYGNEALNENNLVCQAIKFIKKNYKNEIGIMCDVALDPYTSHGHDGIIKKNEILNDETLEILIKQSILQAKMGCDVIAPSDMMDGRVLKIRKALDKNNLKDVQILWGTLQIERILSSLCLRKAKRGFHLDARALCSSRCYINPPPLSTTLSLSLFYPSFRILADVVLKLNTASLSVPFSSLFSIF